MVEHKAKYLAVCCCYSLVKAVTQMRCLGMSYWSYTEMKRMWPRKMRHGEEERGMLKWREWQGSWNDATAKEWKNQGNFTKYKSVVEGGLQRE